MTKLEFILSKNLSAGQITAINQESLASYSIKKETEKAKLLEWNTDFGKISSWVPVSCIDVEPLVINENSNTLFSKDDKVNHKTFGIGTVLSCDNELVEVKFAKRTIQLVISIANLEKIN